MTMFTTKSWTDYVIDRPMATQPGTRFVYNTAASHLVSGVISILTGRPAVALAAKRLFAPLGIRQYKWLTAPEGVTAGGFGLQLQPRDLAKLAFLYLHHGRWDGHQIVLAAWVEQSTRDQVADPRYEYGYLWWLDRADGYAYMAGLYGQLAVVDSGKDLVAVITAHFPGTVDANSVNAGCSRRTSCRQPAERRPSSSRATSSYERSRSAWSYTFVVSISSSACVRSLERLEACADGLG